MNIYEYMFIYSHIHGSLDMNINGIYEDINIHECMSVHLHLTQFFLAINVLTAAHARPKTRLMCN